MEPVVTRDHGIASAIGFKADGAQPVAAVPYVRVGSRRARESEDGLSEVVAEPWVVGRKHGKKRRHLCRVQRGVWYEEGAVPFAQ